MLIFPHCHCEAQRDAATERSDIFHSRGMSVAKYRFWVLGLTLSGHPHF